MATTTAANPTGLPVLRVAGVPEHFNWPWHIAIDVRTHPTPRTPNPRPITTLSRTITVSHPLSPSPLSTVSAVCLRAPVCWWSGRM